MLNLLTEFWPLIIAGIGILFGGFQKFQATKAKSEAKDERSRANTFKDAAIKNSIDAEVAHQMIDEIISGDEEARRKVVLDVEKAKSNRSHFSAD